MSLAISSSSSVRAADPTASLREALVGFEGVLTDEQKIRYKASTATPDASSALVFVAQIDNENRDTTRRCVAPRLCTFLEGTQQFTGVVDTFVSSNPAIAALIWGGIKMTILTANNVTSYFEKVTDMIMTIGRSCPTYQQFGHLYPGCTGLQRALCNYFAIVVRLCTKIIEVSRRSTVTQTISSMFTPFEADFRGLLSDLDRATQDIQQQISLASKQANYEAKSLLEYEIKNNERHRLSASIFRRDVRIEHADAQKWRVSHAKRETARLKLNVRDNLSTINHVKPWKQNVRQRVPATAEWLQQEPAFKQWLNDQDTAILWLSGKMGVGKSILVSNVVTQLHASSQPTSVIAYYFCRGDHVISLSARNVLGSLTRQLLDGHIEHANDNTLQDLHRDSQDLSTSDVVDLLLARLEPGKTYFLIVDGLDKCENVELREVARSMAAIHEQRKGCVKILLAGRPEFEKELFRSINPRYKISVAQTKVAADIDLYIAIQIE